MNSQGQTERVSGSKPYEVFEKAILKMKPEAKKLVYSTEGLSVFGHYKSFTINEYSALKGISKEEAFKQLEGFTQTEHLIKLNTKNGPLYTLKSKALEK